MLKQYYRINEVTGVSIAIRPDGSLLINACSIMLNQNKLDFEKKVTDLTSIDDLTKHFPGKSIVALNFSGKGILQKQIAKEESINQNNFNKILPGANIDDFYIQHFISGEQSFVSVIRKADADKWIDQLRIASLNPLMLSIGPFPVQNIISQLNVYDQDFVFDGHRIKRNEELEWTSSNYSETAVAPFPLKIESENINERLVIPYAAAFQLALAAKVPLIHAEVPALQTAFDDITATKKLKVKGALILSVFFILLLVNFLVLSYLNSANTKLIEQVAQSAQSSNDVQGLNDQVKQKEALLQELGWDGGINKSVLIDQLASILPKELTLETISANPIDAASTRTQKSLAFFDRQIRITGNSDKIIPVNEWIARLKIRPWVKNIQLDSYSFNNEQNTGQFAVVINY